MTTRPGVLFVCVHDAGRPQMAAAYARHLSSGTVEVRSAGSEPADAINPAVHAAMLEAVRPILEDIKDRVRALSSLPA